MKMKVSIPRKNEKVPCSNVSLPPIVACNHDAPCRKAGQCYACKFYAWPSVKKAWAGNLQIVKSDRADYFSQISATIAKRGEKWFRWHVSGDILDQDYIDRMNAVARQNPSVRFLTFTKMHNLDYSGTPKNHRIVFSYWPGWGTVDKRRPAAFMQDGTENRVPKSAWRCPGNCAGCMACWNLPAGKAVVFDKH